MDDDALREDKLDDAVRDLEDDDDTAREDEDDELLRLFTNRCTDSRRSDSLTPWSAMTVVNCRQGHGNGCNKRERCWLVAGRKGGIKCAMLLQTTGIIYPYTDAYSS